MSLKMIGRGRMGENDTGNDATDGKREKTRHR